MTDHHHTAARTTAHDSVGTMERHDVERLASLDDWELADEDQDLRGKALHAADGRVLGRISDMLVDLDQERVVALRLENQQVVDVDRVDIRDGNVMLLGAVAGATAGAATAATAEQRVPIVKEELDIGKRVVDLANVRVRSRVVERPVSEQVAVHREHVDVTRRPVAQEISGREAEAMLRDGVVEVTERGEQVVVGKTANVVEEVVVRKDVETHQEQVRDTVRHTEVEVDRDDAQSRGARR